MIGFPKSELDPRILNKFFLIHAVYCSCKMYLMSSVVPNTFSIVNALSVIGASSTVVRANPRLASIFKKPVFDLFFFIAE